MPHVKCTKQMSCFFLFKHRCSTFRAALLRRRCYRATRKVNANGYHTDTLWTQHGSLPRTPKPQLENHWGYTHTAQAYRDTTLKQRKLRANEIHKLTPSHRKWISESCWLSDRQIVCLQIMEPQKWGWGAILKFIYWKKERARLKKMRDEEKVRMK